jgi:hypothetical protein
VASRTEDGSPSRGERLDDEERVAAGQAPQPVGVDVGRPGQVAHGRLRQRRQRHAPGCGAGDEVADEHRQSRVDGQLVVAIGDEDHRPGVLDPPRQQTQHVDRGRVGPVGVLEHGDRGRPRAQSAEDQPGQGERVLPVGPRRLGPDDLAQRRQGHGHRERLAGAKQEGRPLSEPSAQRAHQRRLADARLAGHEHELAAPVARRLHDRLQRRQLLAALQQRIHGAILVAPTAYAALHSAGRPKCRKAPGSRKATSSLIRAPSRASTMMSCAAKAPCSSLHR